VMTVLISSIPVSAHLPGYFRALGKMRLHKLVPISLLKTGAMAKRFFTNEKNDDKKLIWQIIRESDPVMIRWTMQAILTWQNDHVPEPVCHIHGTSDEILPIKYTQPTHTIKRGSHMMVMEQADRVNDILQNALRL
jgi:pimeloyl-ACP methyl ester carboxylesterase